MSALASLLPESPSFWFTVAELLFVASVFYAKGWYKAVPVLKLSPAGRPR